MDRSAASQTLERVLRWSVCAWVSKKTQSHIWHETKVWSSSFPYWLSWVLFTGVEGTWDQTESCWCFWYLPPVRFYWCKPPHTLHHLLFSIADVTMYLVADVNQSTSVSSPKWHETLVIFKMWVGIIFSGVLGSPVVFVEALFSCGHGC